MYICLLHKVVNACVLDFIAYFTCKLNFSILNKGKTNKVVAI